MEKDKEKTEDEINDNHESQNVADPKEEKVDEECLPIFSRGLGIG